MRAGAAPACQSFTCTRAHAPLPAAPLHPTPPSLTCSTKLAWIREAALALNPSDPGLRGHLRPVLEQVAAALQRCTADAKGADAAACKLAMHVVRSQLTE